MDHFSHEATLTVERIHEHTIAGLPALDTGTNLQDLTCDVETDDDRKRDFDSGHTANGKHVVVIEGGRPYTNDDMVVGNGRIRKVRYILETIQTSLSFQNYSSHHAPLLL